MASCKNSWVTCLRLLDFLPFLSYNYGCVNIQKSVVIISTKERGKGGKMKGKGLYIAAGVVLVLALGCLFTGEVQSFGGGVILAAALVAYSQWKKKHPVSKTSELHTIEGREGSKTIRETVSYFLIFPRKKTELVSIRSRHCPVGHSFGEWNEKVHRGAAQSDRFEKPGHEGLGLISYDVDSGTAKISGSTGTEYTTALDYCSCPDFDKRSKPCKHIYFLALQMGYTSDDFYSC